MSEPALPFVSVLVAARNEADTLGDCLTALTRLDYPTDRYEVLVGNDQSTDETAFVALRFVAGHPHVHLIDVRPQPTDVPARLNGKANVLAQLAQQARGELLCITDADVRVPPSWLTGLLAEFGPDTGIVTGTTLVQGTSFWARLQAIDWLLAFGLIQLATYLRLPLTGSGNNMAVRRVAYDAVGGFAGPPFSVVEDYTLFQAIVAKGYRHAHRLRPDVLAETLPTPTLGTYLQQRKRWMQGAFSLPIPLLGGVLFQYLLVPILLAVALFAPKTALCIYGAKWLFQTGVAFWTLHRTGQGHRWPDLFLYEPCQIGLGTLSFLYYLLPIPIRWKGRAYS
ncbi:1,2-diacylglycerol 3-glucosyltransferase [Fibrella aestuarina BUZ 2]|uniref:1,2-diacylglycerol 3-glucosyltransferase n=1 Tax=Fibrella aestuarina BUZ 2 TaxID=1166018 RepID=I0K7T7_9BACT|nr:glycosyltransferase [Fibrella aestuarina]CCH00190.1 1,2-diacylglycerol 3-glucosyltransferase [Fibrella aestuarina BUZ 2]